MTTWPDEARNLIEVFGVEVPPQSKRAAFRSVLLRFHDYVTKRSGPRCVNCRVLKAWLRNYLGRWSADTAVKHIQWLNRFLGWLAARRAIEANPLVELKAGYGYPSTAAVARALLSRNPIKTLEVARPLPRYGSFRYADEDRFLRFDRFLQQRVGAERESLATLVREYAALAPSAATNLERIKVGRVLAAALIRGGRPAVIPRAERFLTQQARRERCRPYIYTTDEVGRLLEAALQYPSPNAPLRPIGLRTMLVLAYCAGLRLGETVGLALSDVDVTGHVIEVRDTKFFKSRRLPISSSATTALAEYLSSRRKFGAPQGPKTPLFWHGKGGYSQTAAGALLRKVVRRAGLNTVRGWGGPRIHDLRHTFVVHRITAWYQQGLNPESRLPYLSAYLGHRDIYSTLVYITITRELLQHASDRHRLSAPEVLTAIRGKT
jgi:integrase